MGRDDTYKIFQECWAPRISLFPLLQELCGGLAASFPSTTSVKSDLSIISWDKYDRRMDITDLSLDGIMHLKQYCRVQKLSCDLSEKNSVRSE